MSDSFSTAFHTNCLTVQALILDYDDNILVSKGSAVNLLIVRPFSYLYTKLTQFMSDWILASSIKHLLTTQDTSDSVADMVASNYYVYRKTGTYAKGSVVVTLGVANSKITTGSAFSIDGHSFGVLTTTIITGTKQQSTLTVTYVQSHPAGTSTYKAIIPVIALTPGYVLIPLGVSVSVLKLIPGILYALICSPISGGGNIETNAEMFARCRDKCAATTGSSRAIATRLMDSPYPVLSSRSIGTTLFGCLRARDNNTLLPLSASVDTFVKTMNQPQIDYKTVQLISVDSVPGFIFSTSDYPDIAGAIAVLSVTKDNVQQLRYTVEYGSDNAGLTSLAARLSKYQQVTVKCPDLDVGDLCVVCFKYMPYIADIQDYIQSIDNGFIGLDILIKSAIPVALHIQCGVRSESVIQLLTMLLIRLNLAKIVNQLGVGTLVLNMDDISKKFTSLYPLLSLKLPYTIQALITTTNGGSYSFSTVSGVVDLRYRDNMYLWQPDGYFMYTTKLFVTLEQV